MRVRDVGAGGDLDGVVDAWLAPVAELNLRLGMVLQIASAAGLFLSASARSSS